MENYNEQIEQVKKEADKLMMNKIIKYEKKNQRTQTICRGYV